MILLGTDPTHEASFSLRNRIARAAWQFAWLILFRPSPRPFHAWRAMLLRAFGAEVGRHVHVYPSVRIWAPWNLHIESFSGIGDGASIYNMARISIGSRAVISQGAHLCCGSHDIDSVNFQLISKPITIERFAWICADVFIGPGVTIAEGNVIAARSAVFRTPSGTWGVWSGNPPARIRSRSDSIKSNFMGDE